MIKRICLILLMLSVFNTNFLSAKEIKPGVIIVKENYKEYLSELNELIPKPFLDFYIIPALEKGLLKMPIVEPKKYIPYFGIEEWAKKNEGVCKIGPQGKLLNWIAGPPFPNPKTARELAWDLNMNQYMEQGSYRPLRWMLFENLFKKERYVETEPLFTWVWKGRTYTHPIPEIKPNPDHIYWKELISFSYPFDAKGFTIVRIRYMDPKNPFKEDDSWAYIPLLRRIRRFTGADNQDPLFGTDVPADDHSVMAQRIDDRIMDFKILGEKVFLVPAKFDSQDIKDKLDSNMGVVKPKGWEKKLCYIFEIGIKDPTYMYSKRVFYISKDELINLATVAYMVRYDQKGRVWRIQMGLQFNKKGNENGNYENWVAGTTIDCQTKHATVYDMW